jgi:CDP-diacylglycerol--glycerol-3-phosphate 3-phosphatidyltransferase
VVKSEILYVSNLITLSRLVLLIVTSFFLLDDKFFEASVVVVIMWLSDLLDGYAARKRNEVSTLGKIIDPAADKICVVIICIVMFSKHLIPLWFILILIARDVAISIGGIYLRKRTEIVPMSNVTGKVSVFVIGFALWFILFQKGLKINGNWELISNVLIFISLVMVIVSLYSYSKVFLEFIKSKGS